MCPKLIFVCILPDRGRKDIQYGGNIFEEAQKVQYYFIHCLLCCRRPSTPPQGPSIVDCDNKQKGLLPRVVDGIFNAIKPSDDKVKYTIKLSMV